MIQTLFRKLRTPCYPLPVLAMLMVGALSASPATAQTGAPTAQSLKTCLNDLEKTARAKGIDSVIYRQLTGSIEPEPSVLDKLDYQPEFVRPVWSYLATLVDAERIAKGREKWQTHRQVLAGITEQYGVPPQVVLAIWGVESDYGRNLGTRPLLPSLATLSCFGRRQAFFRDEFIAAIGIVANGDTKQEQLNGSWAGAFGHTQFMPTTFLRTAVDHDGDGHRDLVGSTADALASTANYLQKSGWTRDEPWGYEVSLPKEILAHADSRADRKPLRQWLAEGVTAVNLKEQDKLSKLDPQLAAGVIRPAVTGGPAFIVFRNFDAIFAYNRSIKYALAIAHLSDRIAGGTPFVTPWPTTDRSLSRAQARELQTLLLLRGYDIGPVDGIIGPASRQAIRSEQERLGLPPTGHADQGILEDLQTRQ